MTPSTLTTRLRPSGFGRAGLGSTSVVTDESGIMIELLDYNPYGTERISWSSSSTDGSAESQKTYIGEYSDDESGLSYLNARYYDPGRGEFLSQDTVFINLGTQDKRGVMLLLDPQLMNSYQYGRGNPIAFKDGSGEFIETVFDLISIALSAYDYQHSRSFGSAVFLGLDLIGIVPGIPSGVGYVRHGARTIEIAKYFHKVAGNNINAVVRLGGLFVENIGFKFSQRAWSRGEAGNDVASLVGHFVKHGNDPLIQAKNVGDYYNKANEFIDSGNYKSWTDKKGTTYYNKETGQVAYTNKSGDISSYYQVDRSNPNNTDTINKLDSNYDSR